MNPTLHSNLSWTLWGEQYLLFNPQNRSTIRISANDKEWITTLDGQLSLEGLEENSTDPHHLLHTMEQLCRGRFLENSEEVFAFLFPNQATHSWAPPKRQWLYGVLTSKTVHWPAPLKDASILLSVCILLFGIGVLRLWMLDVPLTTHPWAIQNNWLLGSIASYIGTSLAMSLGTVFQASMASSHNPTVTIQLKHTLGILHLSTNRFPIFHSPISTQRQYAGIGIGAILSTIGLCWILESFLNNSVGANISIALLLLLMWDLCPFYDTNGAQLLETVTVHKQRLRTQDFLRSSLLRSPFGSVDGQAGLHITLSIWLVWFGIAVQLLSQYVLPHIATLLIQAIQHPLILGQFWLGAVCLVVSFYYGYFLFQGLRLSGNLLEQIVPKRIQQTRSVPTDAEYKEWKKNLSELPEVQSVNDIKQTHVRKISANARIDTLIAPKELWIVVEGQIAFVSPKAEGGFETLIEYPPPSIVLCPSISQDMPVLWSVSDISLLCLSYHPEHWTDIAVRFSLLKSTHPFAELETSWQWVLACQTSIHRLSANDTLIQQGESADTLYIVQDGSFTVQTESPIVLSSPSIVGEMGILSEAPRNATIECTQDGSVLAIPAHIIRVCLQQHPSMQEWMRRLIHQRLGESHESE